MTGHFKLPLTLTRSLLIAACVAGSTSSFAARCSIWNEITFADGVKGCLNDYAIGWIRPRGTLGYLAHVMSGHAYAAVAMTSKDAKCPVVVGLGTVPKSAYSTASESAKKTANAYALRSCKAQLEDSTASTGAPCGCEIVVTDGVSAMTKTAFDALAEPAKDD